MKVKQYSVKQLEQKIETLNNFKGTKYEKNSDKRYIRAYTEQLNEKRAKENTQE